jgi:hypothetical protein
MDNVKLYLGVAIKNRFWILCGVVVVRGLGQSQRNHQERHKGH